MSILLPSCLYPPPPLSLSLILIALLLIYCLAFFMALTSLEASVCALHFPNLVNFLELKRICTANSIGKTIYFCSQVDCMFRVIKEPDQ